MQSAAAAVKLDVVCRVASLQLGHDELPGKLVPDWFEPKRQKIKTIYYQNSISKSNGATLHLVNNSNIFWLINETLDGDLFASMNK